jgi:dCTP deaminase
MAIKSDKWIRRMAAEHGMIEPFSPELVREVNGQKIVSYGTSSYGYDIRCAREFKVFTNINSTVVDPKNFDPKSFVEVESDVCIIPPNSFALARTMEYFRIPRSVLTVCLGKSTYARCGIIVNVTPFEPEWEGYVTLEFSNTTPLPAKIYAGEGCAQVLFFESDEFVLFCDPLRRVAAFQGINYAFPLPRHHHRRRLPFGKYLRSGHPGFGRCY